MALDYDEQAAVLGRYAIGLTGDASRAEDVVRETLLLGVAASGSDIHPIRIPYGAW
jgi:DNA-directed RNA polymerase specialized sigma24 family protein